MVSLALDNNLLKLLLNCWKYFTEASFCLVMFL